MSSAPHVERFKGTDWEECQEFIVAIRARALWEGKQRDPVWKADFAGPLFWRKALLWHTQLSDDVRDDWNKLEVALLKRWPPPEDEDELQIQPTPAAAPAQRPNDKADHPSLSVLKIVLDQSNTTYYVTPPDVVSEVTSNMNEALQVRCNSFSSSALLERTDRSCHSWLAVKWHSSDPSIRAGSTNYASITSVDSDTLKSYWSSDYPFQLLTCTVLEDGEVIPVWKKDDTSKITLVPFIGGSGGLYLAIDPEAYAQQNETEKRGKFFIEPLTK